MSKYSFLVQTKAEEFCELLPGIRLKKYGGWLVAEAIEQEEISKLQSQSTIRAVQLAKKIALAKDIPLDEAFGLLQGGGGSITEAELLSEYTEETLSMITSGSSVESTNARMVTAFIRSRGQGMIDGEWQDLLDWEVEDTKTLPRKAIAKVVEFIAEEQNAETQEAVAAKKSSEEEWSSVAEMLEARARNQLKSLTDWNEIYFRLSASDLRDPRWHADRFGRQPLSAVKKALKYLDKHDVAKYNVQSVAIAKLGTMAAGMMAGRKSKVKPDDFLPFDTKALKKDDGVTDASLIVLQRLMKTRRMNGRVIALLADEMKSFSGRNQEQ